MEKKLQNNILKKKLTRRVGISNSSLNDIENGRVAKPDSEILKKFQNNKTYLCNNF